MSAGDLEDKFKLASALLNGAAREWAQADHASRGRNNNRQTRAARRSAENHLHMAVYAFENALEPCLQAMFPGPVGELAAVEALLAVGLAPRYSAEAVEP